jgi:hypothetical protein
MQIAFYIGVLAAEGGDGAYDAGRLVGTLLVWIGLPALLIGLVIWQVRRNRQSPGHPVPAPQAGAPPPGWHPDPHGQARLRYWNGVAWTEHTQN